jgi:GNAT superfamily N-acetyltransferase
LQRIELLAGERFLEVDMRDIAADEPHSLEELADFARVGRAWVAVDDAVPIGYVLSSRVDDNAHIVQVSVVPEMQGRGVGRALIAAVEAWAIALGLPAITLTTFSTVPWNMPLYEHLGFHVMKEDEIGPELAAIRDHESSVGLNPEIRVCMMRSMPTPARELPSA